jgi:hypothetical protein
MAKRTRTEFDGYVEELFEPDDPPAAGGNGAARPSGGGAGASAADSWPVLNPAAYHGLAGRVVATILPHTESDPVALLIQFLVSFGSAVGRGPHCLAEDTRHFANLYALLAGDTAKARKGTSAQRIRRIFEVAAPEWTRKCIISGISSGEGIIHAIRDPIFSVKKGVEELTDPGVADKRLMIDEREFSSALDNMRREGNVVSRVLRDAWDSGPVLRSTTKHSPSCATGAHIAVVGHITLDELRRKLDETSMTNGFANRFL